jgi:uncharacterized membrane protein YecN with MAPEG domain
MNVPLTALWAGLLGILSLVLATRVIGVRRTAAIAFGDGTNLELQQRIRVHGNFVEYVPIALVLMLVLELNGASPAVLNGLGGALLLGRALHAFGLSSSTGATFGRFVGTVLTLLVIAIASLLAIYSTFV